MHHRLYVPFAFGALYGHPFEGAILDGLGAGLSAVFAGLSERQIILLFGVATFKTVDDHCGYYFPWYPVHMIFGNNSDYHDIHHQVRTFFSLHDARCLTILRFFPRLSVIGEFLC